MFVRSAAKFLSLLILAGAVLAPQAARAEGIYEFFFGTEPKDFRYSHMTAPILDEQGGGVVRINGSGDRYLYKPTVISDNAVPLSAPMTMTPQAAPVIQSSMSAPMAAPEPIIYNAQTQEWPKN